ncbi:ATP-binding cassette domain-containing protein [Shinella zoogloeoides]|uniref:ATP-binding cassette domain-containing protein n=1 Tax=Shinella zoogloeoides TaxID=352475 RepID=UPI0028AACF47|nr:ATP-binding cassette domain-containing protein [Shinella zoogloeoides]
MSPIIEARAITKTFGNVVSLNNVDVAVYEGKVTCVLGDNGAGKSTLIKTLAGFHRPDKGEILIDGQVTRFRSPQDARRAGIAVVYQDLAMQPLMPIWRNFFLGSEIVKRVGPFRFLDKAKSREICRLELNRLGIDIRDTEQPVGTLSGGERQSIAIARAAYFGARVLILDEPTSALGVRQAGNVLKHIQKAREAGHGIVFITHSPAHAMMVGDIFTVLNRGRTIGTYTADDISEQELVRQMSGGRELERLREEMRKGAS